MLPGSTSRGNSFLLSYFASEFEYVTILTANPQSTPVSFELCLDEIYYYSGTVYVLFEDWEITMTSGCYSDTLAPLETRALRVPIEIVNEESGDILNPSFELTHSAGYPDSFNRIVSVNSDSTVFIDTRLAKQGEHSLRLTTTSVTTPAAVRSMPFTASNTSSLSIYAFGEPGLIFSLCSSSSSCETFSLEDQGPYNGLLLFLLNLLTKPS